MSDDNWFQAATHSGSVETGKWYDVKLTVAGDSVKAWLENTRITMVLLNIIGSIAESFTNNLITEDRYRMILDGLQVTLLITVCAALLGTLLGGLRPC